MLQWLKEGFILQCPQGVYTAQGPFQKGAQPKAYSIFAPDFFLNKKYFLYPKKGGFVCRQKILKYVNAKKEVFPAPLWQDPCKEDFYKIYKEFQKSCRQGLEKAVCVLPALSSTPLSLQKRAFLLSNALLQKKGFVYGLWSQNEGIIGVTPEYLFNKTKQNIHTMALAGTGKRNSSDLIQDPKEMNEHQIVIQGIQRQWRGFHIQKSKTYEYKIGSLKHLKTCLSIKAPRYLQFFSILNRMHPTPALGGYPQKESVMWLHRHNNVLRQRFGAPFALLFPNEDAFCLTAIRNIQWSRRTVFLCSGCGLTKGSQFDKEWMELKIKRQAVVQQLWNKKYSTGMN